MSEKKGILTSTSMRLVVTPHNLILEWLLYYGWIGVLLGLSLIIACIRFTKQFMRENKLNVKRYQIGVMISCAMIHNLFFALTNVTASDVFSTYFLYFPIVVLMSISRNEESYLN